MIKLNIFLFLANFFRTLLIIVVVYYLIRFITRVVIPLFNSSQSTQPNFRQQNRRPEGDVTIENNRKKGSHISKDEGEYVDFEEID